MRLRTSDAKTLSRASPLMDINFNLYFTNVPLWEHSLKLRSNREYALFTHENLMGVECFAWSFKK